MKFIVAIWPFFSNFAKTFNAIQAMQSRAIELLAPARNASIAMEAIDHGADAVYIGAMTHGARASASNSLSDISKVVDHAHQFNAKVYVTVNTIIYDNELRDVELMIYDLYRIGVDALIVQDMAILRMDIPPIALHASTQCDIRTPQKAKFLADVGFSQLVLPREFTLSEINEIYRCVDVPLESFVHGALCVSYSGACRASCLTMHRSANRGECAQLCRLPYDLCDADGNVIVKGKHLLSLRDLNRSADINEMLQAGVSSFKIEGRLKDSAYVKNVVALYREKIDMAISQHPDLYHRSSIGRSRISFIPDAYKSFNRGFTKFCLKKPDGQSKMATIDTPKWKGEPIGRTVKSMGKIIKANLSVPLHNGDGIGYFNSEGTFSGFRINKAIGSELHLAESLKIPANTPLYRNYDKEWDDKISSAKAIRRIKVAMTLRESENNIILDAIDESGHMASVSENSTFDKALSSQAEQRRRILSKTGDTIFELTEINDLIPHRFIAASTLTQLRRNALQAMNSTIKATYKYDYRRPEKEDAKLHVTEITEDENVANRLSEAFYRNHGATSIKRAVETDNSGVEKCSRVMTSRYCIRRELNRCLNTPQGREWPRELYLRSASSVFKLKFNCKKCIMYVDLLAHNVKND